MALLAANLTLLALVGTLQAAPHPGEPAIPPEVTARIEAALEARDRSTPPRTRHLTPLGEPRFANRLILEKSPYLQQHAFNPVNWYPWGEEAFARAEKLERLVFLSIGYSTCHWCHVMEEESFEDLEVAEVLNRHFITIKVDREERPDIDGIYMEAVRTLTKRGGWPLTVLLTPDGYPIYGGTYFPPRDGARGRRPGLLSILKQVRLNYEENPARARASALSLVARVQANLDPPPAVGIPGPSEIRKALSNYKRRFDNTNGGVQSRTKFPSSLPIPFLLRAHRRSG
ncbi:MAG: thioredoxin domain-containing protein, partial [Myxococcota bacterium]